MGARAHDPRPHLDVFCSAESRATIALAARCSGGGPPANGRRSMRTNSCNARQKGDIVSRLAGTAAPYSLRYLYRGNAQATGDATHADRGLQGQGMAVRHGAMGILSSALRKRVAGVLLLLLGTLALSAPLAVGGWSVSILGLPLIALSLAEAYTAFRSPRRGEVSAYLPCALAMLAGNLLLEYRAGRQRLVGPRVCDPGD